MAHCAEDTCLAAATVLYTARGGLGDVRYRAALACEAHRRKIRGWVARAGPTVHEEVVPPDPDHTPATLF
ncbi:hypothetical protein BJF79_13515 [Actinomadura sp. CNU-125]|uniref:hypothetical protein n=1 Tax=Actinomadura sp. CNU-125 TaxID=1904961 RepID=UPI000965B1C5|nr:hypothetical protein [Actinomadura sp. CNU-125]OLT24357.1 hypothetical protein BJF79_13515 [Actinomadura sp. CNU-125]